MKTDQKNTDSEEYPHAELTGRVIGVFYDVYNELEFGFAEEVYHQAMVLALREAGFKIESKAKIPVYFRGRPIANYEADILVEGLVILELKATNALDPAHEAQLLNYLRATDMELGLLLNFGSKPVVRRRIFDNERKRSRGQPDSNCS
ncbi:MAG: GxxExxY protein [Planctomycetia bacterium]|nr:GxxExxY protein [Planctomycetia bacterium]